MVMDGIDRSPCCAIALGRCNDRRRDSDRSRCASPPAAVPEGLAAQSEAVETSPGRHQPPRYETWVNGATAKPPPSAGETNACTFGASNEPIRPPVTRDVDWLHSAPRQKTDDTSHEVPAPFGDINQVIVDMPALPGRHLPLPGFCTLSAVSSHLASWLYFTPLPPVGLPSRPPELFPHDQAERLSASRCCPCIRHPHARCSHPAGRCSPGLFPSPRSTSELVGRNALPS